MTRSAHSPICEVDVEGLPVGLQPDRKGPSRQASRSSVSWRVLIARPQPGNCSSTFWPRWLNLNAAGFRSAFGPERKVSGFETEAARHLGVPRSTLQRLLAQKPPNPPAKSARNPGCSEHRLEWPGIIRFWAGLEWWPSFTSALRQSRYDSPGGRNPGVPDVCSDQRMRREPGSPLVSAPLGLHAVTSPGTAVVAIDIFCVI